MLTRQGSLIGSVTKVLEHVGLGDADHRPNERGQRARAGIARAGRRRGLRRTATLTMEFVAGDGRREGRRLVLTSGIGGRLSRRTS